MTNDDWKEIFPDEAEIPEGYVGNLTEEHYQILCETWRAFFGICDRATGKDDVNREGFAEDWGVEEEAADEKKSSGGGLKAIGNMTKAVKGSGVKKDDNAKAEAQKRTEESNMNALLVKYGSEALRNAFIEMCKRDNPDLLMLRYIRARKWDVDQIVAMLGSALKWRLDTNLDVLVQNGDLENGKTIPKYVSEFLRNGKVFMLGTNKQNQTVMYVKFGIHYIFSQPLSTTRKFIINEFEAVRLTLVGSNDKILLLFDCTGFGPGNLDIINFLYILQCLQSYFPEQLQTLILHKAPWILSQAWHVVKYMLDPFVRAKVRFTTKPEELLKFVPKEHLLKYIGGDVDINFEFVEPEEGENDKHKETEERQRRWENHRRLFDEYERVTRLWADSNGKEHNEERNTLTKKLRLSFLDYEPYYRGKIPHDRNGDFSKENPGIIRWQYPLVNGEKRREILGRYGCRKTLIRELHEIALGATVEQAEQHTKELIENDKWGHWNTCNDIKYPTGFTNGQFTYDGGNSRSIDVIGLNGPETVNNDAANKKGIKNSEIVPAKKTEANNEKTIQEPKKENATQERSSSPVVNEKTPREPEKRRNSRPPNGNLDEKQKNRKSFFGNLKSKIMV